MATDLHHTRLDAVVQCLLASRARVVADLGCGHGELIERLRDHAQFSLILGIDIDPVSLDCARDRLGLDILDQDSRLRVLAGSFENSDWLNGVAIDAAVMLETIEHIDPGRLSRVERAIFGQIQPKMVVITTPNKEYNILHGLSPEHKRHPGHRFEWTRAQFRSWCEGVAQRNGYAILFQDVGPRDSLRGSSTQMAQFSRL